MTRADDSWNLYIIWCALPLGLMITHVEVLPCRRLISILVTLTCIMARRCDDNRLTQVAVDTMLSAVGGDFVPYYRLVLCGDVIVYGLGVVYSLVMLFFLQMAVTEPTRLQKRQYRVQRTYCVLL